jgi:hypothetical protein
MPVAIDDHEDPYSADGSAQRNRRDERHLSVTRYQWINGRLLPIKPPSILAFLPRTPGSPALGKLG